MKAQLLACLMLVSVASARAEESKQLRVSVAGDAAPLAQVEASPGETLLLKADVYVTGSQCGVLTGCGLGMAPAEFLWTSDDRPEAVCGLTSGSHCIAETRFSPAAAGVTFHVPDNFDAPMTVVVRERGASLMGTLVVVPHPAPVVATESPTPVYFVRTPPAPPPVVVVRPYQHRWGPYWPRYSPRHYPHGPSVHVTIGGHHRRAH